MVMYGSISLHIGDFFVHYIINNSGDCDGDHSGNGDDHNIDDCKYGDDSNGGDDSGGGSGFAW